MVRCVTLVAATAIALWSLGCDSVPTQTLFGGTFSYAAQDSLGRPVALGMLVLDAHVDSSVIGAWYFTIVANADTAAARWHDRGSGALTGRVANNILSVNLDPVLPDVGNHFLTAHVAWGELAGDWGVYFGFINAPSPGKIGTFTAVRR